MNKLKWMKCNKDTESRKDIKDIKDPKQSWIWCASVSCRKVYAHLRHFETTPSLSRRERWVCRERDRQFACILYSGCISTHSRLLYVFVFSSYCARGAFYFLSIVVVLHDSCIRTYTHIRARFLFAPNSRANRRVSLHRCQHWRICLPVLWTYIAFFPELQLLFPRFSFS